MQGKKGSKRIEMIIKMVNEFKLTVVHFARPNPMQICACAWIYRWTKKKTVENQGSPGRKVVAGRGPWAAGRWATGLLLAKPACVLLSVCSLHFTLSLQFTCCTWNWLAQETTTNRIILIQGLIIIRSKRNTFIIRNQNKRK